MYKRVRILTQSPSEILLYPGRIVDVYFNMVDQPSGGIIYYGLGETYIPKKPDFEFQILK